MYRRLCVRKLTEAHNISGFACGNAEIDDVLHDPDRLAGCGDTYAVADESNPSDVLACFTLLSDLAEVEAGTGSFEFVLLNILAVSTQHQRTGIGRWIVDLLVHDIVSNSRPGMTPFLLTEPFDSAAKDFFKCLNIGFEELPSGRLVLAYEKMCMLCGLFGHPNNLSPEL